MLLCGSWRGQVLEGLSGLTSLTELWLGKNKIPTIQVCQPGLGLAALRPSLTSVLRWRVCRPAGPRLADCFSAAGPAGNSVSCVCVSCHADLRRYLCTRAQSNRLESMADGLRHLTNLEELYLSENAIPKICGVETLVRVPTVGHRCNGSCSLTAAP